MSTTGTRKRLTPQIYVNNLENHPSFKGRNVHDGEKLEFLIIQAFRSDPFDDLAFEAAKLLVNPKSVLWFNKKNGLGLLSVTIREMSSLLELEYSRWQTAPTRIKAGFLDHIQKRQKEFLNFLETLLAKGANPYVDKLCLHQLFNPENVTPNIAFLYRDPCLRLLMKRNVQMDAWDRDQKTSLVRAIECGDFLSVEALIQAGAEKYFTAASPKGIFVYALDLLKAKLNKLNLHENDNNRINSMQACRNLAKVIAILRYHGCDKGKKLTDFTRLEIFVCHNDPYLLGDLAEDRIFDFFDLDQIFVQATTDQLYQLLLKALAYKKNKFIIKRILAVYPDALNRMVNEPEDVRIDICRTAIFNWHASIFEKLLKTDFDPLKKVPVRYCHAVANECVISALYATNLAGRDGYVKTYLKNLLYKAKLINPREEEWSESEIYTSSKFWLRIFFHGNPQQKKMASDFIDAHVDIEFLSRLNDVDFNEWLAALIYFPKLLHILGKNLSRLDTLQIYDNGISIDNWSDLAREVLRREPEPEKTIPLHLQKLQQLLPKKTKDSKEHKTPNLHAKANLNDYPEWEFLRLVGRTILLQDKSGNILAFKIKKKNESVTDLQAECTTTRYLKKNAKNPSLQLQSYLPDAHGVYEVDSIMAFLNKQKVNPDQMAMFEDLVGEGVEHAAGFIYKVDAAHRDYFTYLDDEELSRLKIAAANRAIVNDHARLTKQGWLDDEFIPMFHNIESGAEEKRQDRGRYYTLVNILRHFRGGSGRLTHWKQSVQWSNGRATGKADWSRLRTILDYTENKEFLEENFGETYAHYEEYTGNLTCANMVAEHQLALMLVSALRCCKLTEKEEKNSTSKEALTKIWREAAEQIIANCAQAMALYSNAPEDVCLRFLQQTVNVEHLANQMHFWLIPKNYVPFVKENRVPEGLYDNEVKITVLMEKFREETFNEVAGFSIDQKNSDIGPVNGPNPMKEADKLFHWLVIGCTVLKRQHQLQERARLDIMRETDWFEAERKFNESRSFVPHPQTNATMCAIYQRELDKCEKKLGGQESKDEVKGLNTEWKSVFQTKIKEQQKELAVLRIQRKARSQMHQARVEEKFEDEKRLNHHKENTKKTRAEYKEYKKTHEYKEYKEHKQHVRPLVSKFFAPLNTKTVDLQPPKLAKKSVPPESMMEFPSVVEPLTL